MIKRLIILKFINEFIEESSLDSFTLRVNMDDTIHELFALIDECCQDFLMVIEGEYGVYIERLDMYEMDRVSDFIDYIIENMTD